MREELVQDLAEDTDPDITIAAVWPPDCDKPFSESGLPLTDAQRRKFEDFCASTPATGELHQEVENALDEIEQKGGECAMIAQRGREILSHGDFRFHSRTGGSGGWGLSYGGTAGTIILDKLWLNGNVRAPHPVLDDEANEWITVGFVFAVVHEIDHVLGNHHLDGYEFLTKHSQQCSPDS